MLSLMENTEKQNSYNELGTEGIISVQGRFGEYQIDTSKAIYFPRGILGFKPDIHFALVNFNKQGLENFKVLQCVEDANLALPVLPSPLKNNIIDSKDMQECIKSLDLSEENTAVLFISSSTKKSDGNYDVFINAKAPIIIDTQNQVAVQYVFTNAKYSIKHKI
ncbi:MAG: flagellar assembly protein FliW [Rickettsiales bacterium]|nr:flagellar assembly protein FliW [Rickettsiales bacterium]